MHKEPTSTMISLKSFNPEPILPEISLAKHTLIYKNYRQASIGLVLSCCQ